MPRRREKPLKRTNPSGKTVWVARWTDKTSKRRYGWPPDIPGTHRLRGEAQDAIDACYKREDEGAARPGTFGGYASTWQDVHPRARVTDRTNKSRLNAVLDVEVEGAPLREWPFDQLRRRHANLLVGALFDAGRSHSGVVGIIGTLSAMTEDAIDDEVTVANPFRGVKVRANDRRIKTPPRPVRVLSWQEMHAFARACADATDRGEEMCAWRRIYAEPMIRTLSDCGLRAGELLALYRSHVSFSDGTLEIRQTESCGEILQGTKTTHGIAGGGRTVPVPPDLLRMLDALPRRIDTPLLFPTPEGGLWPYVRWWRAVWSPGRDVAGSDVRPHEFRHSYVSLLRASSIDVADLADVAGHTVQTATERYTHGLGKSFEAIKRAVGE